MWHFIAKAECSSLEGLGEQMPWEPPAPEASVFYTQHVLGLGFLTPDGLSRMRVQSQSISERESLPQIMTTVVAESLGKRRGIWRAELASAPLSHLTRQKSHFTSVQLVFPTVTKSGDMRLCLGSNPKCD